MQLEVGATMQGKVTGITKYGAFVDLGSGKSGMVHISEIASAYVKEIKDYVSIGQEVSVKLLSISEDGKLSLSMKQAEGAAAAAPQSGERSDERQQRRNNQKPRRDNFASYDRQQSEPKSFDEMLSRFMQTSDEKMSDLRSKTGERRPSRKNYHQ